MARITRVKKAQQRYQTVPVLDDDGNPKRVPVLHQRGPNKGQQVVTKRGPKWMTVTTVDKTKPKPNLRCDYPGCEIDGREILPGTPYMWIKPKSGPYGGHLKARHAQHPAWNVWDYSDSLSANLARIESEASDGLASVESVEDAQSVLEAAASEIRDLAERKRESASNIEDGFGHATYQSEELEQQADDLDGWADEVEATDLPDQDEYAGPVECDECDGDGEVKDACPDCGGDGVLDDEPEEPECPTCDGSGEVTDSCDSCGGTGEQEGDDLTDEQMDEWREAVIEAAMEALGNCPV